MAERIRARAGGCIQGREGVPIPVPEVVCIPDLGAELTPDLAEACIPDLEAAHIPGRVVVFIPDLEAAFIRVLVGAFTLVLEVVCIRGLMQILSWLYSHLGRYS